jgi:DNA invertase Pin-like site-specific DNA recombinase
MDPLLVGYARVSTDRQDLTARRNSLAVLGVGDDRIYVDHGLTDTNRDRPGLRLALAACHGGDTLVVTSLDRLARSSPDARDILDELTKRHVRLSLGGSIHDPTDPVGRLLLNVLGRQPKLSRIQSRHLVELNDRGSYITAELAELLRVSRATVYRAIQREHIGQRRLRRAVSAACQ